MYLTEGGPGGGGDNDPWCRACKQPVPPRDLVWLRLPTTQPALAN